MTAAKKDRHRIGVVSDTHGLIRPSVLDAMKDVECIVHAGDIGAKKVLDNLGGVAPVVAVRGNMDGGAWARSLPETAVLEIGGLRLFVLHDLGRLDLDPASAGFAAVISGHSHLPSTTTRNGVLYVNPGSAGPRRFSLPISVAALHIEAGRLHPQVILLKA
jgi:putative phosphoesterase